MNSKKSASMRACWTSLVSSVIVFSSIDSSSFLQWRRPLHSSVSTRQEMWLLRFFLWVVCGSANQLLSSTGTGWMGGRGVVSSVYFGPFVFVSVVCAVNLHVLVVMLLLLLYKLLTSPRPYVANARKSSNVMLKTLCCVVHTAWLRPWRRIRRNATSALPQFPAPWT